MSARPFNCSQSRQCKTPHRHVATCSRQHSYVLLQEKWKLKKGSPVCTCFARFLFGGRLVAWQTEHAGVSNESIWINLGHWFGSGLVDIATAETLELDGISLYFLMAWLVLVVLGNVTLWTYGIWLICSRGDWLRGTRENRQTWQHIQHIPWTECSIRQWTLFVSRILNLFKTFQGQQQETCPAEFTSSPHIASAGHALLFPWGQTLNLFTVRQGIAALDLQSMFHVHF